MTRNTVDHIRELTRTHIIQTEYHTDDGTRWHYTHAPALLTQLETATRPTAEGPGTGGSAPAAWLDPLDTLRDINDEATRWLTRLGHTDTTHTITATVLRVGSLHPTAGTHQNRLERDVRSWWTQARIVTGWDNPAWRPTNTCPLCATKGSLRIKLADHLGRCVTCGECWDATTIGLLADHIRAENDEAAA